MARDEESGRKLRVPLRCLDRRTRGAGHGPPPYLPPVRPQPS